MKKKATAEPFTDAWNEPFDKATQARMKREFEQDMKKQAAVRAKKLKQTTHRTFLLQVTIPVNGMEKFMLDVLPAAAKKKLQPKLARLKEMLVFELPEFTSIDLEKHMQPGKDRAQIKKIMALAWQQFETARKEKK